MSLENKNNNNNKRKFEGGSFEEKVSIVLNDLAGFSDFCTELHKVSHCPVQDCKVGEFIINLLLIFIMIILKPSKLCLIVA